MERKEMLMVAIIGVLLLTTAIQTVQLVGLSKSEIIVPTTSSASSTPSLSSGSGQSSTPANLQDLPSMVGGC